MTEEQDIVAAVQARMGSRRFPGKVLAEVAGKPMLVFLLERLKKALPWRIVVATTVLPRDDAIEKAARAAGFEVFRGDEDDVFSRYQIVASATGARHVVRLTGDNPLVDTDVALACVSFHEKNPADITSTREMKPDGTIVRHVPKGFSVDVLTARTLLGIDSRSLAPFEREHVIPVFFRPPYRANVLKGLRPKGEPVSVDTSADLEKLRLILNALR